jgi:hypothetical protein
MGKRVLGVVGALLAICLIYYAYQKHLSTLATDGSTQMDDTDTPAARDDKAPSAETQTPAPTPTPSSTPALTGNATSAMERQDSAADSIQPNPPNGAVFAGTGKFQVYRQGNLTWRVDTQSGASCILFATMEEWKKPVVYHHACSNGK